MQNVKNVTMLNGNQKAVKTAEPVTWNPGGPLLLDAVFNIEVLEQEFAFIKQTNRGRFTIETSERIEYVHLSARDIFNLSDTYVEPQRAAQLIRECV